MSINSRVHLGGKFTARLFVWQNGRKRRMTSFVELLTLRQHSIKLDVIPSFRFGLITD